MRQDNYSYALIRHEEVVLIDPSESSASEEYFRHKPHLKLVAILNTHSHFDHVGGNESLYKIWRCPIYGPALEKDRIPCGSNFLSDKEEIKVLGITISAHDVRAHTAGHMAFLVKEPVAKFIKHGHRSDAYEPTDLSNRSVLFVGDSLFAAGCGRLFEGTPEDLKRCLSFYARQDPNLVMACAHEYTKANLAFAQSIFPHSEAIKKRAQNIDDLLHNEGASVPCLFGLEQETNPFLLALREPYTQELAQKFALLAQDHTAIIAALRRAKDQF